MYDLALFDLDGTLTDPKEGITNSVIYALKSFGITVGDPNDLTKWIGPPLRESFAKFCGFSPEDAEKAVSKYREYFSPIGIFENKPYKDVISSLGLLRERGVKLAVATCKARQYAVRIAERYRFKDYFEFISGCEFDGSRSTKAEVIEYALAHIDPARKLKTVMIGDREHDIIGAKETGIDSIGVLWGYGSREELEGAGAGRIVATAAELAEALTK